MTNELAIKTLHRCQYGTTYPLYEALDMAIEALSAQEKPYLWQKEMVKILSAQLDNNSTEVDKENDELSCSEKPNRSEPLTDKEQRIFLAAMGRERKVCKQVDDEWRDYREPYEDSLVSVCNEIERKVKGALWGGR